MPEPDQTGRRLKLRQLEILSAVAECGTMGKAAERLAISQPVVSKAIADLEYTLGVRLFDRGPQGVEPTLYGRALLKCGIAIFDELRQGIKEIKFLSDPNAGELHVGCTESLTAGLVSDVIDRLSRRFPRLVIHLALADVGTLQFRFLRERRCELIVGRVLSSVPEPDMDAEVLFYEQHLVVTKPPNKWLKQRRIGLADLIDEPWILAPLEIQPGTPVVEAFRAVGLQLPQGLIVSNSLNLRNSLLATGRFVTVVPGSVLRFVPKHLLLKVLPVKLPRSKLPIAIVTLKNRTLSPIAQLFIDYARELAKPLANEK
jgi:DNA-binding transcriptional LysR family regulator